MFDQCKHGYLSMTCPTCQGRGATNRPSLTPAQQVPTTDPNTAPPAPGRTMNFLPYLDRVTRDVEASMDRQAWAEKSSWSAINEPTTREDHPFDDPS